MKLIIGLGNIGSEYQRTRHNAGFAALDTFAAEYSLTWLAKSRFKAEVAEGVIGEHKVVLAKPTTFYNLTGESAQALQQFYKVPTESVLVAHDELALPFGTIRYRLGGSSAGNNGIKSIATAIGDNFMRLRIGITNDHTPNTDAADFVLARFSATEQDAFPKIYEHTTKYILDFIEEKLQTHTSRM